MNFVRLSHDRETTPDEDCSRNVAINIKSDSIVRQTNKDDLSILHHNEQKTYFITSFLLVQNRQRTAGVIGVSISKI